MRIIAGEFRGRKLLPPATDATRPITDRVKQSLFDILTPLLTDARVYDCFAGTGSMGLESLSRGAAHATFFEADRSAAKRLRDNIRALGVEERSAIVATDVFRWFADPRNTGQASIVFLDPPYRFLDERPQDLRQLASDLAARHLAPGAAVILRHRADQSLDLPPLMPAASRAYGGMTIQFLAAGSTTYTG